jgi:FtsP/CotA-like multicopper oxidase with cupredoxin domain
MASTRRRRCESSGYPMRAVVTCVALAALVLASPFRAAAAAERIAINDNRTAAGAQSAGILTIRLEARVGTWHPDRESDPGVEVKAFAVDGGPLQIPGPLIRVREGTEIRARIRNALDESLVVHGLYTRPDLEKGSGPVTIPAGESREIAFLAGRGGTYYYWGASASDTTLPLRAPRDSQLVGAFIVDARDGTPALDRVLVMSNWPPQQPGAGQGRTPNAWPIRLATPFVCG